MSHGALDLPTAASRPGPLRRLIEQVSDALERRTALDIRGGGTKAFYGQAPRGTPLEVAAVSGITAYEPTELVVTALAGTPLAELEAVLAEGGQCLAFEPPRFAPGGSVGGMVAAGLSGPARASVGPLRDFLLGVTLLNGKSELLRFGGQVMKNVAGYDVSRVMAGSLGILGVLCEVSLKVVPRAAASVTLEFAMDEGEALLEMRRAVRAAEPLTATSWWAGRLRMRVAGAEAPVRQAQRRLGGNALEAAEAVPWWTALRDHRHDFLAPSAEALAGGDRLWRVALPDAAASLDLPGEQLIEWHGTQRWLRTAAPAALVREAASRAGGHATLFRAADRSLPAFTPPTAASWDIHRRLKTAFDPHGIFNPGRLYPDL